MVTLEELRALYYAKPFRPFVLVLEDGRRVRIRDPIFVSFSPRARTVAFPEGRSAIDWVSFDRVLRIDVPKARTRSKRRKAS
jgi:hypothetical protein